MSMSPGPGCANTESWGCQGSRARLGATEPCECSCPNSVDGSQVLISLLLHTREHLRQDTVPPLSTAPEWQSQRTGLLRAERPWPLPFPYFRHPQNGRTKPVCQISGLKGGKICRSWREEKGEEGNRKKHLINIISTFHTDHLLRKYLFYQKMQLYKWMLIFE